jgi:hypothetical protein
LRRNHHQVRVSGDHSAAGISQPGFDQSAPLAWIAAATRRDSPWRKSYQPNIVENTFLWYDENIGE